MYITNVTDYDNMTDDYNNNCTNIENIFDIIIPTLIFTIPCGLAVLCLNEFDGIHIN